MALTNGVWSERETGDWEACVVTSYEMGLLHGGAVIPAPYTQAERERLEKVKDEPQDLFTTDAMSLATYGVKLRTLTVSTVLAAATRPGIGLVLTGRGSPGYQWQAGFAGLHEVFYLPTSATAGLLYDPLAPMNHAPESFTAAKIAAWAKGPGTNDAREVGFEEFAMQITVSRYPGPRTIAVKVGALTGYRPSPAPTTKSATWANPSSTTADAEVNFSPLPPGWPPNPYQRIIAGAYAGFCLSNGQVGLGPLPPTYTQAQLDAAVAAGKKTGKHDGATAVSAAAAAEAAKY